MKLHIGVDAQTGLVHRFDTTPANVHDVTQAHRLLHGGELQVWGGTGYVVVQKRAENLELEAWAERVKASIRAKVEHPFLDLKGGFGYAKSRYRGLAKNTERLALLLGLPNLKKAQRWLAAG